MSLDINLTATIETEVVDKNITHNLSTMWKQAGVYEALYESKGKTAKDVLPILKQGLEKMVQQPSYFKQFNASNGWGKYEDAINFLVELIEEFEKFPDGVIGIRR